MNEAYERMRAEHEWRVPDRYNIAQDVCDKHPRDKLAMIWEDWQGNERRVAWGELQDLSNKFANVLEANGVERGDRVATLLPSLPETAAVFLGTYRSGAILLSMSVLYGDEGIEHRLRRVAGRMPPSLGPLAVDLADRLAPALGGGTVYTDDKAPVEWLVDKSIVDYANSGE